MEPAAVDLAPAVERGAQRGGGAAVGASDASGAGAASALQGGGDAGTSGAARGVAAAPAGAWTNGAGPGAVVAAASASLLLVGVALVLTAAQRPTGPLYGFWREALAAAVAFVTVGAVLTLRRPEHRVGRLFSLSGLAASLQLAAGQHAVLAAAEGWPAAGVTGVVAPLAQSVAVAGLVALALLFPSGTLPSRRWRPVAWTAAVGFTSACVATVVGPARLADAGGIANPAHVPVDGPTATAVVAVVAVLCAVGAAGALASLVARFRAGSVRERVQLKWFLWALLTTAVVLVAGDLLVPGAGDLGWLLGPAAAAAGAAVAVLRHDLYDIDLLIRRSCAFVVLSVLVVVAYVLVVQSVAAVLPAAGGTTASVVATAAVALVFAPAREQTQRLVDRVLFGERRDPYRAVTLLAERMHEALAPEQVLQEAVDTVARTLRSPYVAIDVEAAGEQRVAAASGREQPTVLRLPLTHHQQPVGQLSIAARSGERDFSPQDVRLLGALTRQIGVAAHAVALTSALQHSRAQLVVAREEERRRLRRDLHDGLGPTLTGVTLLADAARSRLGPDSEDADRLLRELRAETRGAIDSIRRLVYDLRPPALDELGLVGALREQAARLRTADGSGAPLGVDVLADELPTLPAAVEVAAYRIVTEALTNVARHAGARRCTVRLHLTDRLRLEVSDDGIGLPEGCRAGVGMASLRERAAELGGCSSVGRGDQGGTVVRAELPLALS